MHKVSARKEVVVKLRCMVCDYLREQRGLPFCAKSGTTIWAGSMSRPRSRNKVTGGCTAPAAGNTVQRLGPLFEALPGMSEGAAEGTGKGSRA